jgi:hypothetical protein
MLRAGRLNIRVCSRVLAHPGNRLASPATTRNATTVMPSLTAFVEVKQRAGPPSTIRPRDAAKLPRGMHSGESSYRCCRERPNSHSIVAPFASAFRVCIPLAEKYLRQQIENRAAARREARRDSRLA